MGRAFHGAMKKTSNKLSLNKLSVARLSVGQLAQVAGGGVTDFECSVLQVGPALNSNANKQGRCGVF